jgi:hypothetical protein
MTLREQIEAVVRKAKAANADDERNGEGSFYVLGYIACAQDVLRVLDGKTPASAYWEV